MKDFKIKTIWTNEISNAEIEDFRYVVNSVFGDFCTEEYFRVKYLENIYGPSYIIMVYLDDKPIGVTSLWRNDVGGKEAYQNAETSVIQSAHSNGVFAVMTMTKSKFISQKQGIPIYSFPNTNSFPGYKKMKWNIRWNRKVVFVPGISSSKQLLHVDGDYASWWLKRRGGISYIKRFGHYYLVKATTGLGYVLGTVDEGTALQFPKSEKRYLVLYYESDKRTFYNHNKKMRPLVYCNVDDFQVPYWKTDAF